MWTWQVAVHQGTIDPSYERIPSLILLGSSSSTTAMKPAAESAMGMAPGMPLAMSVSTNPAIARVSETH